MKISRKEAMSNGLVRYFTGEKCKRGHVAERYTKSRKCVLCSAKSNPSGSRNPTHDDIVSNYRYDEETGFLYKRKGSSLIKQQSKNTDGYITTSFRGVRFLAHRIAWMCVFGEMPSGQIDHINGIRDDNRLVNIRCVSSRENNMNRKTPATSKSGLAGVYWRQDLCSWRVEVTIEGEAIHLGYFKSFDDAKAEREKALKKHGFHDNHGRQV